MTKLARLSFLPWILVTAPACAGSDAIGTPYGVGGQVAHPSWSSGGSPSVSSGGGVATDQANEGSTEASAHTTVGDGVVLGASTGSEDSPAQSPAPENTDQDRASDGGQRVSGSETDVGYANDRGTDADDEQPGEAGPPQKNEDAEPARVHDDLGPPLRPGDTDRMAKHDDAGPPPKQDIGPPPKHDDGG